MSNAADQLKRILHLIPLCADDQPHSIARVAAGVGCDERTLLRDLRELSERFDDPGGFVEGVEIFLDADRFTVRSDHFRRPMRLTLPELGALELGLALLRSERPLEEHGPIEGARTRLRQAMTKLPPEELADGLQHAELPSPADRAHLGELRKALKARRKVRLEYLKAGAEQPAGRTACPFALVYSAGHWYLIGHCDDVESLRIFRLDRVQAVEQLEERYEVPKEFSVDQALEGGRAFIGEVEERLRVRYSPRIARWISERVDRELDADGSITVEHPLGDVEWAVCHVLQYGADAEVLGPEAVRREVAGRLRGMVGEEHPLRQLGAAIGHVPP